jgi:hypothetical protein
MQLVVLVVFVGLVTLAGLEMTRRAAEGRRMERVFESLRLLGAEIESTAPRPTESTTKRQELSEGSDTCIGGSNSRPEAA